MELKDTLLFLSTTGAAVVVFWMMGTYPELSGLPSSWKRFVAFALTAGIAIAAWLVQVVMLYQVAPVDWRAWVEVLFAVGGGSIGLNQLIHGVSMKES